jgi:hypothetical protein
MSTEHTGGYCSHKDKMMMSKAEAKGLARRLRIEAYHCTECDHWHVASKRKPGAKRSATVGADRKALAKRKRP